VTTDPNALFRRAEQAFKQGDPGAAKADITRLRRLVGDHPAVLRLHARIEQALGDVAASRALFEQVMRIAPGDADGWMEMALFLRSIDALAEAADAIARAIAIRPNSPHLRHIEARIALERGHADAPGLYQRLRKSVPDDLGMLLGEAAARFQNDDGTGAAALLDEATAARPDWLEGLNAAARLRWQLGAGEAFAEPYRRALAVRRNDPILWASYLGAVGSTLGHQKVLEELPSARLAAGAHDLFDKLEASALTETAQHDAAAELFARIDCLADPSFGLVYLRHLLRCRKAEEASAFGQQLLSRGAGYEVWPYLSIAWRLLGDPRWDWLDRGSDLISVQDLAELEPLLPDLTEVLRGLHTARVHPFEQSPRGGTQTDGALLARDEPEIRALRDILHAAVARHAEGLPPVEPDHPILGRPRTGLRFVGSWSVRLTGEGFHVSHVHTRGWISAALYVSLPQSLGDGTHGHDGWLALGAPPAELGLDDLKPVRLVEPKPARLVLFPSIMWHGTLPFAEGERLTVAFDATPSGR